MTILFIDDDPDDRELFKEALAIVDVSHKYVEASDGKSALELLKSIVPDCIFLDVRMPEMDGGEILLQIRSLKMLHLVPVVMYSSPMTLDHITKFKNNGATDCIEKPCGFTEICSVLRSSIHDLCIKPTY